jgi:hypothetical protein
VRKRPESVLTLVGKFEGFRGTVYISLVGLGSGSIDGSVSFFLLSAGATIVARGTIGNRNIHFNFVHITDRMIKLNGTSLLETGRATAIVHARLGAGCGCMRVSRRMPQSRCHSICELRYPPLLLLMSSCCCLLRLVTGMRLVVVERRSSGLVWRAKNPFGAFNAMLRLLPASGTLVPVICIIRAALSDRAVWKRRATSSGYRLNSRAHRSCNSDCVRIIPGTAFNPIPWGQECIESLDQVWMPREEFGDTVDDTRRIDTRECQTHIKFHQSYAKLTPGS